MNKNRNLDVFRGLAALCMVYNHAGYAWLQPDSSNTGSTGGWLFATSMAPVLFFLATGIGMGWSARSQPLTASTWRKAGLLFLADVFLNLGGGKLSGLNFFGFIGLSTLLVGAVRSTRQPILWGLCSIFLLLVLRFFPSAVWKESAQQFPLMAFISGIAPISGVSYPLSPWLVYPLLGFVLAHTCPRWPCHMGIIPWLGLTAISLALAVMAAALSLRGAVFFRWGTMSLAYFISSLAGVGFTWLLARICLSIDCLACALMLRGPACLLVVPLHYAAIGWANTVLVRPVHDSSWWLLATALVVAIMVASRCLAYAMAIKPIGAGTMCVFLTIAALTTIASLVADAPELLTLSLACAGQMLVAWELSREGLPHQTDLREVVGAKCG